MVLVLCELHEWDDGGMILVTAKGDRLQGAMWIARQLQRGSMAGASQGTAAAGGDHLGDAVEVHQGCVAHKLGDILGDAAQRR